MNTRIKKGALMVLGVIVIFLGTVDWFVSNSTVSTVMFVIGIAIIGYALFTTDKSGGGEPRRGQRGGRRRGGRNDDYDDFDDFAPARPHPAQRRDPRR